MTISSAKSRSSSVLVKFHLMPFLCFSVVLCIVQSTVSRNRKPDMIYPCLTPVVILNHLVCSPSSSTEIVIHDLHHSCQLVRDAIGLHDSPQSFAVYRVESFFEVDKVRIECCLPLSDLFYDVTEDECLVLCALVLSKSSLFFSKYIVCSVLYSLDDDSPHYFA